MDASTVLSSLVSSGIVSLAAARWLTKRFIDHRFKKDLAEHKGEIEAKVGKELADHNAFLNDKLTTAKAELDASLHRSVEEYIGERAAERQYKFEAQKRLYAAIGQLRFQLVVASGDFAAPLQRIAIANPPYPIPLDSSSVRSTTF